MFSSSISKRANQKVYLLFGRSQSCKSSFIKDICGENTQIEIGTGFGGILTTKNLKLYFGSNPNLLNGARIYFIDTVGWGDSNEDFSNDEITQMISCFLLEKIKQSHIDGILITESMMNDSICLENSLTLLSQIFGASFIDSSIVLATKPNAVVEKEDLEERFDKVQKIAAEKKISGGVMPFETSYKHLLNSVDFSKQLKELNYRLGLLKKLTLMSIEEEEEGVEGEEEVDKEIWENTLNGMFPQMT